jgi:hypothetical protein
VLNRWQTLCNDQKILKTSRLSRIRKTSSTGNVWRLSFGIVAISMIFLWNTIWKESVEVFKAQASQRYFPNFSRLLKNVLISSWYFMIHRYRSISIILWSMVFQSESIKKKLRLTINWNGSLGRSSELRVREWGWVWIRVLTWRNLGGKTGWDFGD